MLKHPDYTRDRVAQLAARIGRKVYRDATPLASLSVSGPHERISEADARQLDDWRDAAPGLVLGPQWATYWFRGRADVPADWRGDRVVLRWDTHSEALVWLDGRSAQGLNPDPGGGVSPFQARDAATLADPAAGGESVEFRVEVACNGLFGGVGHPYRTISPFVLDWAEVARFDADAWRLYHDLFVLAKLEAEQAIVTATSDSGRKTYARGDLDPTWAGLLLSRLNDVANLVDPDDAATWPAARPILDDLYRARNGSVVHELSAIGHAHIDTAWLWPLAETHRKCDRTFSSQAAYMDRYPAYKFACSQAYQYDVVKRRNPDLYARMKKAHRAGQWVPVGGTWVEPDCNLPSGESLVRQFLYGQRFFEAEFGARCREFWNPDVFGYNGQLPQVMNLCGVGRFLTQKLSWNRFTDPPHHTFTWQGLDGSEVLAHFPPADTYNCQVSVKQLRDNARHYKDHDRSRHSLMLFGWGDGGGGPTPHMLEVLGRCGDLQGVPRVKFHTSDEFFDRLEKDLTDRPTVVGELYFEYHRGTYTTQAAAKRDNRRCENLLHDVELLSAVAARAGGFDYPSAEIERLWKLVLLNQFHDILPGSSIAQVYDDTLRQHADVLASGAALRDAALAAIPNLKSQIPDYKSQIPDCKSQIPDSTAPAPAPAPVNTLSFPRREVAALPDGSLAFVDCPPTGVGRLADAGDAATVTDEGDRVVMANRHLRATLTKAGRLVSLVDLATGREFVDGEANVFELYDDKPTKYDAWDIDPFHLETGRPIDATTACRLIDGGTDLRAEVAFEYAVGRESTLAVTARLDAGARRVEFHCDADWRESEKLLKVAHAVTVRAMTATYEMPFGVAERPTHFNTAADVARFEVPGHRFADLSEHGHGVALLSESKYGYSTLGNVMRLSLLRAPKHPDPTADLGRHRFAYALYPHAGRWDVAGVVGEAAAFNQPVLFAPGGGRAGPLFEVEGGGLLLDTVKKAEDSDAMILRFYEPHGGRGTAAVAVGVPFESATFCNGLEDDGDPVPVEGGRLVIDYAPWKVIGVKLA